MDNIKYVYRSSPIHANKYEIGRTSLPVKEINRTGVPNWCDSRICETWSEATAIEIVEALTNLNSK